MFDKQSFVCFNSPVKAWASHSTFANGKGGGAVEIKSALPEWVLVGRADDVF